MTLAAQKSAGPIPVDAPNLEAATTRPGRLRSKSTPGGVDAQEEAAFQAYSRAIECVRLAEPGTREFADAIREANVLCFAYERHARLRTGDLAEGEKRLVLELARDLLRPRVRDVTLRRALRALDDALMPALPRGTLRRIIEGGACD